MTGTVQPTFSNTNGDQQGVSAATPFPVTAIQGTGTSADQVQGNIASAVADAGNPVKVGGKYNASIPIFTDGNRADLQVNTRGSVRTAIMIGGTEVAGTNGGNVEGIAASGIIGLYTLSIGYVSDAGATVYRTRGDTNGLVSQPYAMTASRWQYAAASGGITNTTAAVTLKAAAGASIRNYITGLQISADALGVATEIIINDGAGGTVLWRGKVQTAGLAAITIDFPVPLKGTANTLLEFATVTATVTGGVYVNAQGFTGA